MNNIKLNKVTKTYDGKNVIDELTFSFNSGNLYILKGHSGCGKSTLLSLIGLLDKPSSGQILFDGKEINDANKFAADNMSYVFQDNNIFEDLTVLENLKLISNDKGKIVATLKQFNIDQKIYNKAHTLSKGEKCRLVLCRIILESKPVILLDEPIANLDQDNAELVLSFLSEFSKDKIIILVMHNNIALENYLHILLQMNDGKITSNNQPENFVSSAPASSFLNKRIIFEFAKSIFRKNKFKSFFYIIFQALLSLIIFSFVSITTFNLNGEMAKILSDNNISSLSVFYDGEKNDNLYRTTEITASQNGLSFDLNILYSKSNDFKIDGSNYSVLDDTIYLTNDSITSNSIDINENIMVNNIDLNIVPIDSIYNLISNNTVIKIAQSMSHVLYNRELSDYLKSSHQYFDYYNSSFSILPNNSLENYDSSHASLLKENEVNIILPKNNNYSFEEVFNAIKDKTVDIKYETQIFNLNNVFENVTIKGYIVSETDNFIGLQINQDQYNKMISNLFNNGLLNNSYRNEYLLTSDNYNNFNLSSNIDTYLRECSLTKDDIHALTMIKDIQSISIYIIAFVVLINLATIYFVCEGISRSFRISKNLLYTLGYKRESIIKINLAYVNFVSVLSIALSLILFFSLLNVMNSLYLNLLKTTLTFSLFRFSWLILIFIFGIIVLINIYNVFYKTKKDTTVLLESMKKTLE